jgi:hypothetical protein
VRNKGLIAFASILVATTIASECYSAPSCCDPGKGTQANAAFTPSTQMLQAVPVPTVQSQMERPQARSAVSSAPQARWTVPASAPGAVPVNQPGPNSVQAVASCCAGRNSPYVQTQGGCCGMGAPRAMPQRQGCCGRFSAPAAPSAGSCCGPARGSLLPARGITYLPAATPVVNAVGYAGPTQVGQGKPVTRTMQPVPNRPVYQPIPMETGTSSFSSARQRGLW